MHRLLFSTSTPLYNLPFRLINVISHLQQGRFTGILRAPGLSMWPCTTNLGWGTADACDPENMHKLQSLGGALESLMNTAKSNWKLDVRNIFPLSTTRDAVTTKPKIIGSFSRLLPTQVRCGQFPCSCVLRLCVYSCNGFVHLGQKNSNYYK